MATSTGAPSFDEIIQADRRRRRNEELAREIFGKKQRVNGTANTAKRNSHVPTLASRVGIAKRSSSTSVPFSRVKPFGHHKPPSRPSSAAAQHVRASKFASAVNDPQQAKSVPRGAEAASGFSIKGTAGPKFVVQATNFAPGTTAADIEAAMQTVAMDSTGNNGLLACSILTNNPTVMAEMVFSEGYIADKVIKTFNNKKADGRFLHVYLKPGSPSLALQGKKSEQAPTVSEKPAVGTSKDLFNPPAGETQDVAMSTETSYHNAREEADKDRQSREERRANPDIQDGRYGFGSGRKQGFATEKPREALPPRAGAAKGMDEEHTSRRRDERGPRFDRGDRRDERERHDADHYRDNRPSRYENGSGNNSYGRMYSDNMMRGPPRGSRGGGLRGGYR